MPHTSLCEQCFVVVATGEATFTYFKCSLVIKYRGVQSKGQALPKGHHINQRGHEMIYESWKEKN